MKRLSIAALWCLAWLPAAAILLGGERAAAEEAAPADPALQAAKADFEEGQALYTKEKYDEAAAKFLAAFDRKPFAAFTFNAAVSFEKAGKLGEAVKAFEKYLESDPQAKDAADVKTRIASLQALVAPAPLAAQAPAPVLPAIETKGLVVIDSKPAGATIYLDDKKAGPIGRTPWQGSLDPRAVKVMVEAKGFKPEERTINPRIDKVYEIYVALSEEHFLGWIEVLSNMAGAEVFIDRREGGAIGRTPYTGHLKPGKHTIWVQRPGHDAATKQIEVLPGTANTHMLTLQKVRVGWIAVVGKQSKGGTLTIDGKPACQTPCQHQVDSGKHRVKVEREDMEPYRSELVVDQATQTQINVTFSPKPPRGKAWTAAVLSAAMLGGGTYLGLKTNQLKDDLRADSESRDSLLDSNDPRVQRGKYMAIGTNVLLGLGALTALISAYGFISSGPDSTADVEQRQIGYLPFTIAGGGGLAAQGRF